MAKTFCVIYNPFAMLDDNQAFNYMYWWYDNSIQNEAFVKD